MSIAFFHDCKQLLIHVSGAVILASIVWISDWFVASHVAMLSHNSFDKYKVKKSPVENVCAVFHCAFVLSFIIQSANDLVIVNVSSLFAVIFTISLLVQILSS